VGPRSEGCLIEQREHAGEPPDVVQAAKQRERRPAIPARPRGPNPGRHCSGYQPGRVVGHSRFALSPTRGLSSGQRRHQRSGQPVGHEDTAVKPAVGETGPQGDLHRFAHDEVGVERTVRRETGFDRHLQRFDGCFDQALGRRSPAPPACADDAQIAAANQYVGHGTDRFGVTFGRRPSTSASTS
jgi:hypothetical protein